MINYTALVVFASVLFYASGIELPKDFKICKLAEIDECLKDAIQDALLKLKDGLPQLNFGPLEPLHVPNVTIAGHGTSAVNLEQNFQNVNIYGLPQSRISNAGIVFSGQSYTITIDSFAEKYTMEADYEISGKVLLLSIVGKGKATIIFRNVTSNIKLYGKDIKRKGIVYGTIEKVNCELNPGRLELKLDNLLEGNERLGDEVNKVLNENWQEFWKDSKQEYQRIFEIIMQERASKIMNKIPHNTLFPLD